MSDEPVYFSTRRRPDGHALVAGDGRGLLRISLGDTEEELLSELARRFPQRELRSASGSARRRFSGIFQQLDARPSRRQLPILKLRGTDFQREVWQALRAIPWGQTRTYAEVALAIGRPRATRAVANACGENPIAILIPCHRVVRADGGLGGYRWGVARKRALLEREGVEFSPTGRPLPGQRAVASRHRPLS